MAKTNITRMDGESEADYRRRYNREYERIAAKARRALLTPEQNEARLAARRVYSAEYRKRKLEHVRAKQLAWARENPDKAAAANKRWRVKNPEKGLEASRRYADRNPERRRQIGREYYQRNPWVSSANHARWRADKLRATPKWADMKAIQAVYREAKLRSRREGLIYHVDHYYPLKGKNVCGLHVAENLQIILGSDNSRKKNHHPDEWLSRGPA